MTRTLIISDLHLGGLSGVDLLRRPAIRAALLGELADSGIDRLVLLGDVLELRHGPPHEALEGSRAFFEDLGRALGRDRELVIAAGNHDHLMVGAWLDRRALHEPAPEPLGLEQRIEPAEASPLLARIAQWAAPARVSVAYPGLWVAPGVYAMHGHFLDAHLTIPTLERIGVGAMGRLLERRPSDPAFGSVEDYEAVTAPIYAWRDAITRYTRASPVLNGLATGRAWRALNRASLAESESKSKAEAEAGAKAMAKAGAGAESEAGAKAESEAEVKAMAKAGAKAESEAGAGAGASSMSPNSHRSCPPAYRRIARAAGASVRRGAIRRGFPLMVDGLNRAGLGPLRADISRPELRRSGLRAMGEVAARLGLGDAYVIFGHTHRAGPLPGDSAYEWRGRGGARLVNCGSWVYDAIFLTPTPGESPYWPGTCVVVDDDGGPSAPPPQLHRLLVDRSHADLIALPDTDIDTNTDTDTVAF